MIDRARRIEEREREEAREGGREREMWLSLSGGRKKQLAEEASAVTLAKAAPHSQPGSYHSFYLDLDLAPHFFYFFFIFEYLSCWSVLDSRLGMGFSLTVT